MKKQKILLVGWDQEDCPIQKELCQIAEKYEIIFAIDAVSAIISIGKSAIEEKNPILAVVFNRDFHVIRSPAAKIIKDVAQAHYSDAGSQGFIITVLMIRADRGVDLTEHERDSLISGNRVKQDDWISVLQLLENN